MIAKGKPTISVVFPCFNDQGTIGNLIKETFLILPTLCKNYEVIVVDDGSTDGSCDLLLKLKGQYPNLKLAFHPKNLGYGAALRSGFQKAKGDLIFYTDGDGQYTILELPILIKLMTDDVSFINGIKMTRQDPTYRVVLGNLYSFLARWLFWLPIYDIDCDFRLVRKKLLKKLDLKSNGGAICIELVKKAQRKGAKFRQVSIHHFGRQFGRSQFFRVSRIWQTFLELLVLWVKLMFLDKLFKRPA